MVDKRTYDETGNRFHEETKRVQITFRGTEPADLVLFEEVEVCRAKTGETFSDYVREALRRRVRKC